MARAAVVAVLLVGVGSSLACRGRPKPEPSPQASEAEPTEAKPSATAAPASPVELGPEIFDHVVGQAGEISSASDLVQVPSGNLVAVGTAAPTAVRSDLRLLGFDPLGQVRWDRRYPEYGDHVPAAAILAEGGGGVVVASNHWGSLTPWLGRFDAETGEPAYFARIHERDCRAEGLARVGEELWVVGYCRGMQETTSRPWLGRYAGDGSELGVRSYGQDRLEFMDLVVDDEQVIVVGSTWAKGDRGRLGYVAWLDADGAIERSQTYGDSGIHRFVAAAVTDTGLVVAGSSGTLGASARRWAWALGLNQAGEQVWRYETADRRGAVERVVPIGEDGSVVLLGHIGPSFDGQGWMARLDPRGEPVWSQTYGEARYGKIYDALVLGEGRIVGVGGHAQEQGSAETGFWLLAVDAQGEPAGPSSARNTRSR